jgi:tetratricopeptide (TPR) repeat protein
MITRLMTFAGLCAVILVVIVSPCSAEKIICRDGTVIEGAIIRLEKGIVWVAWEAGSRGIGTKRIEKILNEDGSLSRYDYKHVLGLIEENIKLQKYDEARSLCGSLVNYFDDNTQALYLHAVLSQKTGDTEGAMRDYALLIDRGKADTKTYNNLGSIYASRKDFSKAVDLYKKALARNPGNARAHNNLADVYLLIGKDDQAFEEYNAVAVLEPGNARVFYNMGVLCLKRKDYTRARENWEKSLVLNPENPEAKNALQELSDRKI